MTSHTNGSSYDSQNNEESDLHRTLRSLAQRVAMAEGSIAEAQETARRAEEGHRRQEERIRDLETRLANTEREGREETRRRERAEAERAEAQRRAEAAEAALAEAQARIRRLEEAAARQGATASPPEEQASNTAAADAALAAAQASIQRLEEAVAEAERQRAATLTALQRAHIMIRSAEFREWVGYMIMWVAEVAAGGLLVGLGATIVPPVIAPLLVAGGGILLLDSLLNQSTRKVIWQLLRMAGTELLNALPWPVRRWMMREDPDDVEMGKRSRQS